MKLNLRNVGRSRYLTLAIFVLFGMFVIRLFYIQIIQHDYYQDQANAEQIKKLVLPADRGLIYALDGSNPVKFVMNETVYTVFADPKIIEEPDKISETIKTIAGDKAKDNFTDLLKLSDTRYQILATKLTRKEADAIKEKNFKGIGFQANTQRVYPEGSMAAQLLGFVDYQGIGKYGIEGNLNDRLKGTDGLLQSVTDVRDVPLTVGNQNIKIPKKNGENVVLSIDRNIQAKTEAALADGSKRSGAKNLSAIVMDPTTGQVKAMANYPSYDPSKFYQVTDASLFNNPIISKQYEPGSVMKSFTLVKALDKGIITPETTYVNTDYVTIDDRVISNASKGKTGTITMQTAYDWSLNTGMVEVMKLMGGGSINLQSRQILYNFLHDNLGFGDYTGIELDGENPGIIVGPNTGQADAVRYSNMSFGQGMDVTMLQTAAAYCSIVNGGTYYQPTMLAGNITEEGTFNKFLSKIKKNNVVSWQASRTIRDMAINARKRLASRYDPGGYEIGGKTGTSQVIKNGVYDNVETVGSYIGFGGDDSAKYVIMVIEYGEGQGLGGSRDAMPVFTDISSWLISYLNIKPKG
jgi:cell division protein FtsI/penicillin-binding protein 2